MDRKRYKYGQQCTVPLSWEHETGNRSFFFDARNDAEEIADDVAEFYAAKIVPIFAKYASYPAIIPCLENFAESWGGWDMSLLLAYQLSGKKTQAERFEKERAMKCRADEKYSEYFSPFLARYRGEFCT